jgi:predicted dehydrogenase
MATTTTGGWTRRDFLGSAGAVAAAAALPAWFLEACPAPALGRENSPNERPRVALIGCGGMGTADATNAQRFGDIVAVCDVDESHLERAVATFKGAKVFHDYREVCDRPDVDVIINGTPDHWHTLVNLRAVGCGKDVYSEKPLTLTIDEGKRIVAAVRESGRILQTGSQQRSDATFRLACELVRNGRVGKVERVRVWIPMGRREGPFAARPVPAGLNWDFWQGQTASVDYVPERCHGNFRYWWDYSGGTMTDWGAHHNDIALWGLGKDRSGPVSIEGEALVEPIAGGYTAASEYRVKYVYDDGAEHFCQSTKASGPGGAVLSEPGPGEKLHGVQFEGADGWIYVTREGKIEASDPALVSTPLGSNAERLYASNDHMGNFFECVRTRKAPVADVEIGHRSASICHLGVMAIRLGRKLHWDPQAETFAGDEEAAGMLSRSMRAPYAYDGA